MSTVTRYPLLQTHMQHSRLTPLALALMLASTGVFAADNEGVEEIVVIGQGIGTLRLNAANGAGSRLGLSALDTPASVDLVTRTEIMAKGDYSAIDSITRTAGLSTTSTATVACRCRAVVSTAMALPSIPTTAPASTSLPAL